MLTPSFQSQLPGTHRVRTANIRSTNLRTRVPSPTLPTLSYSPPLNHNPIDHSKHRGILLSNFFAQPEALAFGKTEEEEKELGPNASEGLIKSKVFEGNRPNTSTMFPLLKPATLGGCFAFPLSLLFGSVNWLL